MPLYDLTCQNCGYTYADVLSMKEDGPFRCPQCEYINALRIFPTKAPAIVTSQKSSNRRKRFR